LNEEKKIGNIKKLDGKLCYQVFDRSNSALSLAIIAEVFC
jgi:hypothetical protein